MKPVLKWAGGKTQSLKYIKDNLPKKYNNYFEPFLGGAAVALNLEFKGTFVLSDINKELMNFYEVIRDEPTEIMNLIDEWKIQYEANPEDFFNQLRNLDREANFWNYENKLRNAARTLFLNKTCFNGLFRVNAKGEFNVPWNRSLKVPAIYEKDNVLEFSKFLNKSSLYHFDFENILPLVKKGDFVYIDPPYDKLKKDSFVSYNKQEFGIYHQKKLALFCEELDRMGVYFLVSNNNTELINEIYKKFNIVLIEARKNISSKSESRKPIKELLIKNY